QALAADLPQPAPPPPPRAPATYVPVPVQVFSWTGFYLGINAGYGFGTVTPSGGTPSFTANGFLGGGTLGGNYQWGQIVLGVEGDGDYDSLKVSPAGLGGSTFSSNWLATVRGRAGYAF